MKSTTRGLMLASMLAGLSVLCSLAEAQSANLSKSVGSTAVLGWTAPVANTDGTPISGPITYTVYLLSGSTSTPVAANLTTNMWTTPALATVGTICWDVTATVAGKESVATSPICVSVVAPTPNPPTGLTVH